MSHRPHVLWTDDMDAIIRAGIAAGLTLQAIGVSLGIGKSSIHNRMLTLGLKHQVSRPTRRQTYRTAAEVLFEAPAEDRAALLTELPDVVRSTLETYAGRGYPPSPDLRSDWRHWCAGVDALQSSMRRAGMA